jgi:hypothetical protein
MNHTLNTIFLTDSTVPLFLLHLRETLSVATAVRRIQSMRAIYSPSVENSNSLSAIFLGEEGEF